MRWTGAPGGVAGWVQQETSRTLRQKVPGKTITPEVKRYFFILQNFGLFLPDGQPSSTASTWMGLDCGGRTGRTLPAISFPFTSNFFTPRCLPFGFFTVMT